MISPSNLMLMNAGKSIFHEETTQIIGAEALQIFILPEEKDLEPQVQFAEMTFPEVSDWRLIGGPTDSNAPLVIRQKVVIYDLHGKQGESFTLPNMEGYTPIPEALVTGRKYVVLKLLL